MNVYTLTEIFEKSRLYMIIILRFETIWRKSVFRRVMYSTKYVLKENISEKTFPVQQVEYKERTAHLPVEPSFLCVFLIFFLIFLFLKKCFFSFYHLINTVNILCNILHIFYTVSLPLLVLIFSGKTSFVVEPAPQAIIVWRSSKVRPCLDTKVKENKLSLIKLIF